MCEGGIQGFVDALQDFDERQSLQFNQTWDEGRVIVDSFEFVVNT